MLGLYGGVCLGMMAASGASALLEHTCACDPTPVPACCRVCLQPVPLSNWPVFFYFLAYVLLVSYTFINMYVGEWPAAQPNAP